MNCRQPIQEIKWLDYNIYRYAESFLIINANALVQIEKVLLNSPEYFFVCRQLKITKYESFLNSIKIEEIIPPVYSVIKLSSMHNKCVYEKTVLDGISYVILDTLDLKNII